VIPSEVTPESLDQTAHVAYRAGKLDEAARVFDEVRSTFAASNRPIEAAEAANNLCVALLGLGRPSQALDAVRSTPGIFEQVGLFPQAALAHGNLAAALEACGNLPEAELAYERAIALLTQVGDSENRATCQAALSRIQLRRGRPLEALSSVQASLAGRERVGVPQRLLRGLLKVPFRLLRRG
jgi:tetratricopeptide (TPR) repeat protein